MELKQIEIKKINPAPYNPRKDLSPEDPEYKKIQRSIDEFGFVEPLVWNRRSGNLVGGHQRLKVLSARGDTEVYVSVVDLTPDQEKALNIALNQIRGEWDDEKLATLLSELVEAPDIDVEVTGFDTPDIQDLISRVLDSQSLEGSEDDFDVDAALDARRRSKPWRENRFRLPNGAMACAYGTGQNLRGARNGEHRPGLIIADDLENQEQVISEEQRKKLSAWFNRTLIRAGHPETNVIVIGTVLHHDSLLAGLIDPHDRRGWTGLRFQAVEQFSDRPDLWDRWASIFRDLEEYEGKTGLEAAKAFYESDEAAMLEGTKVLWPEREDYHALMVMREREGRASFQAEKQNEPVDPELCVFADHDFHYWDDEHDDEQSLLRALSTNGYFYGACDPSLGKRTGQGDYTAIIILYHLERSEINYVIAADIVRRRPADTIQRIIEYARLYDFENFAVEGNNFQELMIEELKRLASAANVQLPIETVTNRSNKMSRIANLEPVVSQGRVRFCRRHQLLMDQLRQYPFGVHDDGPDALEMAVTVAREPRVTMYVNGVPLLDIWPPPIRGL